VHVLCGDGVEDQFPLKLLSYLSKDDYHLCYDLADAARMTWFSPWIDVSSATEIIREQDKGRFYSRSYRNAVRDLSEGLIDVNFLVMERPMESNQRFRSILRGMGLYDPGDYLETTPKIEAGAPAAECCLVVEEDTRRT